MLVDKRVLVVDHSVVYEFGLVESEVLETVPQVREIEKEDCGGKGESFCKGVVKMQAMRTGKVGCPSGGTCQRYSPRPRTS